MWQGMGSLMSNVRRLLTSRWTFVLVTGLLVALLAEMITGTWRPWRREQRPPLYHVVLAGATISTPIGADDDMSVYLNGTLIFVDPQAVNLSPSTLSSSKPVTATVFGSRSKTRPGNVAT